jgi:hypothetical protein
MTARTVNFGKQDELSRAAAQGRAAPGCNRTGMCGKRTKRNSNFAFGCGRNAGQAARPDFHRLKVRGGIRH